MLDHAALPWFARLNRELAIPLDDAQFDERLRQSTALLRRLARETLARAREDHPQIDGALIEALAGTDTDSDNVEPLLFAKVA